MKNKTLLSKQCPECNFVQTVIFCKCKSSIHWDLVLIQTKEYGGGEIYFDDVLIRKEGIFVHPKLKNALSEEALKD